jgi:hypothetical protein
MPRCLTWYYRKLRATLAHANWLIRKPSPEYREGARVIIRFTSSLHGSVEVLCRIRSITVRFYRLTYDVIVLEDKGWLPFGTRTFVFPENIVRQPALQEDVRVISTPE